MGDETRNDLSAILGQIEIVTSLPFDLTKPNPELVQFLSEFATYLNALVVGEFGGRQGPVREAGLVEQGIGAALQTFHDIDPHPGSFDKAAMLLRGITAGHPFQDGNKRTGFLVTVFYLQQVGHPLPSTLDVDSAEALCVHVSSGRLRDVDLIARALAALWQEDD